MEDFGKQLEKMYDEYRDRFYAAAYALLQNRESAEDAVSETFVRLIENREKFESLPEENRVGYAKTVLKNISLDMIRKRKKHADKELTDDIPDGFSVQDIAEGEAAYRGLVEKIRLMPQSLRQALYLRISFGFKARQIAKALGISSFAARRRLSDAYKLIKEYTEAYRNE